MAGGQQLTSGQGTVTASGGTIQLAGIASAVGQGDLFGSERGQQFTAQQGSITGNLTKNPDGVGDPYTGQVITSGQGTMVAQAGQLTLIGSAATISTGTVYPSGNDVTVNITGMDVDFFTGFIVNGGQPLSGIAITGAQGAYVLSNTLPITGIGVTFGHGSVGVEQDAVDVFITSSHGNSLANADVPLTGSESASAQGTLTITGDITLALTGEVITSDLQTIEHGEEYALTGGLITSGQYPFGAPGYAALTGSQVVVQQNDLYTNDDRTYALIGQGMVISDGNAVTSYLGFATGQVINVEQQGIGPRTVDLVGEQIITRTGEVTPPVVIADVIRPAGGRRRRTNNYLYDRMPTEEEVLEERERLGILPKRAQKMVVNLVKSAANVETRDHAATLASAYLQETHQQKLFDRIQKTAAEDKVKWRDEMFPITQALILDSLRRKANRDLLEKLIADEEAEAAEVNDILELWMEL